MATGGWEVSCCFSNQKEKDLRCEDFFVYLWIQKRGNDASNCIALILWIMAKKKAKKQVAPVVQPKPVQQAVSLPQTEDEALFDLSDPDEFRKAFIASEILNRKY